MNRFEFIEDKEEKTLFNNLLKGYLATTSHLKDMSKLERKKALIKMTEVKEK